MATLPNNISSLTPAEKFDLLDAVWADIEAHTPPLSARQNEELDGRVATYNQDPSAVVAWEQVRAEQPKQ